MNYLARICLRALSFPLFFPHPTFFSLQFPFYLWHFFFLMSFALLRLSAYFYDSSPVPIAPGSFCREVAGSAGKSFVKPIDPQKLLPRKAYTF